MENKKQASFDKAAEQYDAVFTHSQIGRLQRKRVYHWLEKVNFFKTPKRVFEINCGTGYDAQLFFEKGHKVTATDVSERMVQQAKQTRNKEIRFYTCNFKDISKQKDFERAEVLFSNFGGLNCLSPKELNEVLKEITSIQKENDLFIAVLMAKRCLMEDVYYFSKLKWKKIGRRTTKGGLDVNVNNTTVKTYYFNPKEVVDGLGSQYQIQLIKAVAVFLPPSYLEPLFSKNIGLLNFLYRIEKLLGSLSFLAKYADHYVVIAKKMK